MSFNFSPTLITGARICSAGNCRLGELDWDYLHSISIEGILTRVCRDYTPPDGPRALEVQAGKTHLVEANLGGRRRFELS